MQSIQQGRAETVLLESKNLFNERVAKSVEGKGVRLWGFGIAMLSRTQKQTEALPHAIPLFPHLKG